MRHQLNWLELFLCHWMKTGYIIGIYTFLGNVRRSSWLIESSVFHFLTSVYFIPHSRISERKTICLLLKKGVVAYFWRGKHSRKRVLLFYERDIFILVFWGLIAGSARCQRLRRRPFLGNTRTFFLLIESSVFHFHTSVYFIPHSRISEGKTIFLTLKRMLYLSFWRGKHIRKRVR